MIQINWISYVALPWTKAGNTKKFANLSFIQNSEKNCEAESQSLSRRVRRIFPPTEVKGNNLWVLSRPAKSCVREGRKQHIQPSCLFFVTQFWHIVVYSNEKTRIWNKEHLKWRGNIKALYRELAFVEQCIWSLPILAIRVPL